ncbi:MAG: ABC transporter permease [Reyranellaceae bacterium]
MTRYLFLRLAQVVPVLLIVSFMVFSMVLLLPGDPTLSILGDGATQQERANLRSELGLDLPLPVQYARWASKVATGDFGRSLRNREPVAQMLAQRIPVTLQLTVLSMLIAIAIGVPAGTVAAVWRNSPADVAVTLVAMFSMALPPFWAGMLLIMLVCIHLGWLPPSGYVPLSESPVRSLTMMILPTLTLGAAMAGLVMRQTRASMLGVLSTDFIRTARAKGASNARVIVRHGLPNASIPILTVVGLQFGTLLGGAVIIENIFSLPGLGSMIVDAIFNRDFPVVQGGVLAVVVGVLILNVLIDLAYFLIDKRITR